MNNFEDLKWMKCKLCCNVVLYNQTFKCKKCGKNKSKYDLQDDNYYFLKRLYEKQDDEMVFRKKKDK